VKLTSGPRAVGAAAMAQLLRADLPLWGRLVDVL
jgi:hypothetical protein